MYSRPSDALDFLSEEVRFHFSEKAVVWTRKVGRNRNRNILRGPCRARGVVVHTVLALGRRGKEDNRRIQRSRYSPWRTEHHFPPRQTCNNQHDEARAETSNSRYNTRINLPAAGMQ